MRALAHNHKMILGIIFFVLVAAAFLYLQKYGMIPDFTMVKMYRMDIENYLMQNLFSGLLIFTLAYIAIVAFSLPFATPMTILSGFLFGNIVGTGVVAVAATLGATGALLIIRFFFRDYVTHKFGHRLEKINNELTGHGFRDVLLLRLTPIVPFSLINVAVAVTSIRVKDFFFATLVGTLPFTFVYVNAGTQIARIDSASDIISLPVILGISLLVLAASVPLLIRRRHASEYSDTVQ